MSPLHLSVPHRSQHPSGMGTGPGAVLPERLRPHFTIFRENCHTAGELQSLTHVYELSHTQEAGRALPACSGEAEPRHQPCDVAPAPQHRNARRLWDRQARCVRSGAGGYWWVTGSISQGGSPESLGRWGHHAGSPRRSLQFLLASLATAPPAASLDGSTPTETPQHPLPPSLYHPPNPGQNLFLVHLLPPNPAVSLGASASTWTARPSRPLPF